MFARHPRSAPVCLAAILLPAVTSVAGEAVEVRTSSIELPWYEARQVRRLDPGSPRACERYHGTERFAGKRKLETVVLESDMVRVEVLPGHGGAIARAVHKPTGDDFFYWEGRVKNWLPYWESGVKVSFPFREHGIHMGQPTGWRVVRGTDGSATLAMWMEFSRHAEPYQRWIYGRYSDMLLSQHVTVRPGESTFTATFRIVNPAGFRQGRRLWSDVIFPRNHTADGAVQRSEVPPPRTPTEWIYPAAWVSGHGGHNLRRYTGADTPLARYDRTMSIFAWDLPYGFAGLWYPEARISRLVLFDPKVAPGAKQWFGGHTEAVGPSWWNHKYNLVEFWGGSDSVFEGVEHWIEPGETYEFTQRYALAPGIGKVAFANDRAAVSARFGGDDPAVEVVTFASVDRIEASFDGRDLGSASCGPATPARFAIDPEVTGGRLLLTTGGEVILDRVLPLEIPEDTEGHTAIKAACRPSPETNEKCGTGAHWSEMYRAAMHQYPAGSLGRGRLLVRDGYVPAAARCLEKATAADAAEGEAWHLLGLALLEIGRHDEARQALERAVDAERAYPAAGYYLAVIAIGDDRLGDAAEHLAALTDERPRHWEGRLLRVSVMAATGAKDEARRRLDTLEAEDPADPRVLLLRTKIFHQGVEAFEKLCAEPGASARLNEFEAALGGRYKPPKRLGY